MDHRPPEDPRRMPASPCTARARTTSRISTSTFRCSELVVVTGVSGSGKSSLVFDTLYAEGQRRYVETFSPYARQFLDRMDKPQVDRIDGIPPAIAIDQTNPVRTSRSTVGTMTELNDHLKLLFARAAQLYLPATAASRCAATPPRASTPTCTQRARRGRRSAPAASASRCTVPKNFKEAEVRAAARAAGLHAHSSSAQRRHARARSGAGPAAPAATPSARASMRDRSRRRCASGRGAACTSVAVA